VLLNRASESEMALQRAGVQTAALATMKTGLVSPTFDRPQPPPPVASNLQDLPGMPVPEPIHTAPPVFETHHHVEPPPTQGEQEKEVLGFAVALYDFTGTNSDDLPLREHDRCEVLSETDADGWVYVRVDGKAGFVPANYLRMLLGEE